MVFIDTTPWSLLPKKKFLAYPILEFIPFLGIGLIDHGKLESNAHFMANPNYYPPPNEQNVKSNIAREKYDITEFTNCKSSEWIR